MIHIKTANDIPMNYYKFVVKAEEKSNWDVSENIEGIEKNIQKRIKKIKNKDDLQFILFIQRRLKTIILGDVNKLAKIQNIIEVKYKRVWKKIKSYNQASADKKRKFIYTLLEKIFINYGYNRIVSDLIAYKMIEKINLKVCPYCNINYISYSGTNKDKGIRAELDHFYPASCYPYFAISLYNLIPSCRNCNALKSDNFSEELMSPFKISKDNDTFKFKYILKNMNILSLDLKTIENSIDKIAFDKEIAANNKMFHLDTLYQVHKDVVAEIIWKNQNFPEVLRKSYKDFGITPNQAYRILFCNYNNPNEFHQRPLSKLTYDIQSYFK
ncbi:hypothetical protein QUR76_02605 [Arcobacter cryaerophilus gv. pseudocryaerophilus]|uniref:HNH nuclease domain-containing protein n=3 Tax=unclassified Arcobacter TaxID=2593671 RepID=A0AA96L9L0_9BACT|nr:hypothetical protein RMQ65_05490 [Arcobacter sp. AZ-2023]WPD06091.1 hypothetical protein QUR76_02605 [Arcobacter sp. DSM 115956]WPD08183.1 hypothetical protein QUR78_02605 [Arcobacter sp. DSM 115955]WNL32448.1 hypothetical protein RMQ67_02605 [Arcobacter sp. AZ-2023]WNP38598.1 hypothetical protein RJG58_02605 [Arcobacter sp. AZ-2023]